MEATKKPLEKGRQPEAKKKQHVKILFYQYKRLNGKCQKDSLAKGEAPWS